VNGGGQANSVNPFGLKNIIFILGVGVLSGCALPPKVPGELMPVGEAGVNWPGIKRSGVAHEVEVDFLGFAHIKKEGSFFETTDQQITWWAEFQPYALGVFHFMPPTLVARWYAPNKKLYWEEQFITNLGATGAQVSLPLHETPAEEWPGAWYVQVYRDGHLIDEKKFVILKSGK